jgi:hypothetical protein
MTTDKTLSRWHEFVSAPDDGILREILADDAQFHSPFVWKPKRGKEISVAILMTVVEVFQDFRYIRTIVDGNKFALEFEAKVGELSLRGVDLIELNDDSKIIDFEVMIRPANALQSLGMEMGRRLAEKGLL